MQWFLHSIFALTLLVFSLASQGAITEFVISDSTVSFQDLSDPQEIKIFGGFNGACPGTATTGSTCDTCAGRLLGTAFSCNSRAIHTALLLSVNFRVDNVPTGSRFMARIDDSNVTLASETPSSGPVANQSLSVQISWDEICFKASGSTCSTTSNFSEQLRIGVSNGSSSTDFSSEVTVQVVVRGVPTTPAFHARDQIVEACRADEGFCQYRIFPGDEKVYVTDLARASVKPGSSVVSWGALRIYYTVAPQSSPTVGEYQNFVMSNMRFKDFAIKDRASLTSDVVGETIEGLVNGTEYVFIAATLDEAGNVQYFFDPVNLAAAPNRYVAKPENVIGLLQGQECFIATAAFGSKQAWQVQLLRNFRDQILLKSELGKSFVKFYYRYSPPVAQFISEKPMLKQIVRTALWPVTLTASLILDLSQMVSGEVDEK